MLPYNIPSHECLVSSRKKREKEEANLYEAFECIARKRPANNRIPMRCSLQLHTRSATPSFANHRQSFQSQRVESFMPTSKEKIESPDGGNWKEGRSGPRIPKKNRVEGRRGA